MYHRAVTIFDLCIFNGTTYVGFRLDCHRMSSHSYSDSTNLVLSISPFSLLTNKCNKKKIIQAKSCRRIKIYVQSLQFRQYNDNVQREQKPNVICADEKKRKKYEKRSFITSAISCQLNISFFHI